MNDLSSQLVNLRKNYREIFLTTAREILDKVQKIKPEDCEGEIFETFPPKSRGREWQNTVLEHLEQWRTNNYYENMKNYRNECSCEGCGTCCRFAVSEFSPEELKTKAQNGDSFAKQFTETFILYSSIQDAKNIYPEYIDMLEKTGETGYYFYHCPKVTTDNKCPDYENRPQICRDFPDNPIAFLPKTCGFTAWKLKSEHICLKLNAEAEIINFYKAKIKEAQKL